MTVLQTAPLNRSGILTDCAPGWIQTTVLQFRKLLLYSLSYWSIIGCLTKIRTWNNGSKNRCVADYTMRQFAGMENFEIST